MSDMAVDDTVLICPKCEKGREVCTMCWNLDWLVFKQICNCGLYRHGEHKIPCEVVRDEEAHAALFADPRLEAEADHRGRKPAGAWTDEDDALLGELLDG